MEELYEKFIQRLSFVPLDFVRSIIHNIEWDARLIGIRGARGVGKTTLLLQYIKRELHHQLNQTLYVSLDAIWFANHSLTELIDDFYKRGGKYLFLDEVHKYPGWAQELKNAYDQYPDLQLVFTGSSALEILNARADLSRRAVVYDMQGFSYREFVSLESGHEWPLFSLPEIIHRHTELAAEITRNFRPLQYWNAYVKQGYYPFYREQPGLYMHRLSEVINMIIEIELPQLRGVESAFIPKIKQLLAIIASSVPFTPNVSKLSEKIGINRATLLAYLHYLDEIRLSNNLFRESTGISLLQKPLKIYLENTNLMYALSPQNINPGNLRETFFCNQVGFKHRLQYTAHGDFIVDERFVFEIGGKNKSQKQIRSVPEGYVVSDQIEIGFGNKIPLWLFGFLY